MPYLHISSFDRQSGDDSDFVISSNAVVGLGDVGQRFTRCRLTSATICWYAYNVNADNSRFLFQEDGGLAGVRLCTVQLSEGHYDLNSLISALQTNMNAESSQDGFSRTYAVSYSDLTGRVTITASGTFAVLAPAGGRLNGLNQMLGYSMSSDTGYATSHAGQRVANMARYENAYIHSNMVHPSTAYKSGSNRCTDVLARIPVNTLPPFINYHYVPVQGGWSRCNSDLQTISFRFLDEYGQKINLRGGYVTYVIEVE